MPGFDYHIFICTNSREEGHPRGCCDPAKDGMDQCEHGPVVVVYPEGV
jgi:hypothetical protein